MALYGDDRPRCHPEERTLERTMAEPARALAFSVILFGFSAWRFRKQ